MRFPGFEGEWERYRISDLLEFFATNSLSWKQLNYEFGDILNLHYGLIHKGFSVHVDLNKHNLPYINAEYKPRAYSLCENGDIVFADASEDTNDIAKAVELYDCKERKVVAGLHTIHGRDKLGKTIVGFKGYVFASSTFRNQIRQLAQGTKVFSISQKNFNECFIGVPSKKEQDKIANFMRLIDERIQTQMKIIEELEKIRFGLRFQIFKQLKNDNVEVKPIKDLINYEQPTKYLVIDENYSQNPLLTPVLTANKAFVLGYTDENFGIYNKGNCIIFDDFTMDMKYVTFSFKVKSSAIKILKPKSDINLRYVFEYLLSLNLQSGEHKRHYISEIEFKKVPLLAKEYQNSIASLFSSIDNKIIVEKSLLSAYQQQKKYLLQNLFI